MIEMDVVDQTIPAEVASRDAMVAGMSRRS